MDTERIEAALRAGPADEPAYIPGTYTRERLQPLAFVLGGAMVTFAVIVGLVAGMALGLLRGPDASRIGASADLPDNGMLVVESGEFWRADTNPVLLALDPVTGEGRELLECRQECSVWYDAWSPDGQSLLYANGGALYVYDALSDRSRLLAGQEAGAGSWSPNGRQILYESIGRPGGVPSDYFVIDQDGSDERRLDEISGHFTNWNEWTPDGRSIAFFVRTPFGLVGASIAVVDVASGDLRTLATFPVTSACDDHNPTACQHAFAMSPTDASILYATWDPQTNVDTLRVIDAADGRVTESTTWDGSRIDWITWSPDGSRLAMAEGCRVWIMAPNGTDRTLIHEFGNCRTTGRGTWSPDGRLLAAVVNASEDPLASGRLVLLDVQGKSVVATTAIIEDTSFGPSPLGWQPRPRP
jgi:dipeptidyl aminopeptidase/acylaminoacyl peptidase